MKKEEVSKKDVNVEFGNEFLDINASKAYEIPVSNQNKKRKNKK